MLFMGVGISTTRPRQRRLDLQRLVDADRRDRGRSGSSAEEWILANCAASGVEYKGRPAIRLAAGKKEGLAWIERLQTKVSKIDLDIAAIKQDVGMAFHVLDEREFEAICFHIGDEARAEGESQRVVLRYLSRGASSGPNRDERPEAQFELSYDQSGEWFKARITISTEIIAVFINDSNIPSLRVANSAVSEPYGSIGLWVGADSTALVSDFRIHEVKADIESQINRIMGRRESDS